MVRPVTVAVRGPLSQLAVAPPGLAVTVYPVIGEPPSDEGVLQVTVTCPSPAVAETLVGASGTVAVADGAPPPAKPDDGAAVGVTEFDALDDAPSPIAFIAVTVNV